MSENQEAPKGPVFCCYCGNVYPPADQERTSGTITCEYCGRTQYVNGRQTQHQHTIEVICPNRKCGEFTVVNKLQRAGKTKTSCHICREQILIETDGLGKLTEISMVKRTKTLTTTQWMYVTTGALITGLFLGWFFYAGPLGSPSAANPYAPPRTPSLGEANGGSGGRAEVPTAELTPSPVSNTAVTGGQTP